MLPLLAGLLLLGTPVLSDADLKVAERMAARAGVPRGVTESLSADVTGDGSPDVVLLTRTRDRLVLFVVEGPVSPSGRWWRVDLHRGTGPGDLCAPASTARVRVEGHGDVAQVLSCRDQEAAACPIPQGRALRVEAGRCPAVHVFFDGQDLRFWASQFQPARLHRRVDRWPPTSPRPRQTRFES
jgi:hypothetical protein